MRLLVRPGRPDWNLVAGQETGHASRLLFEKLGISQAVRAG